MGAPRIKIYGERNTGTNYLTRLVDLNLEVGCLVGTVPRWWRRIFGRNDASKDRYFRVMYGRNLGWKHMLARDPADVRRASVFSDKLVLLTLTKNPYAWLISLHRRPYHAARKLDDFEAFVQAPWPTVGRENHEAPFANPIDMWNRKNASYLALRDVGALNLRYEDLVLDPGSVLADVAERFSIPRRSPTFRNREESTKKERGKKDFAWYRDYYGQERWRAELSPRALEIVNAHLDPDLVQAFGYEVLTPEVVG